MRNRQVLPRPFLKWAGGKSQILQELITRIPQRFKNYHEPFLGGGAFFFELFRQGKIQKAFLSDINKELIDTYIAIRDCSSQIIDTLSIYPHQADFFYALRAQDPFQMSITERAARTIYLNKTCYNGLFRVNRRGLFNVPFGRFKSPAYCDPDNLVSVSISLQLSEVNCDPFDKVLLKARKGDLVYFDPPYVPLSKTALFTAYQPGGFSSLAQENLHKLCLALSKKQVFVMVSNSDTEFIRKLYTAGDFFLNSIKASRSINCVGKKRGKIPELIITNYPLEKTGQ